MKAMRSPFLKLYLTVSSSSQSTSLTRTSTPGRRESPRTNMSWRDVMRWSLTQEMRWPRLVTEDGGLTDRDLALLNKDSRPPLKQRKQRNGSKKDWLEDCRRSEMEKAWGNRAGQDNCKLTRTPRRCWAWRYCGYNMNKRVPTERNR